MKLLKYRKELKIYIVLLVIGIIGIVIGVMTGKSICIFYNVTGIPCPSCGMTRSILQLLKANIKEAFIIHPLFPLVFIIPFIMNKKKIVYFFIIIFIIVWIIRLAVLFPSNEPMIYNNRSLFYNLYLLIK